MSGNAANGTPQSSRGRSRRQTVAETFLAQMLERERRQEAEVHTEIERAGEGPSSMASASPCNSPHTEQTPSDRVKVEEARALNLSTHRVDTVFGKVSKFRNFKASPLHQSFHIENLRNISSTCPSESVLIQANSERAAVPLDGNGGRVAVFELSKPGKLPDGVVPCLIHSNNVLDFAWDPFDNYRLVVACDDGWLHVWKIPPGGLTESTSEPAHSFVAHMDRISFINFHPLAQGVLATGSADMCMRIWDLSNRVTKIFIPIEEEQIQLFGFAWSPCGTKFATVSKDGILRVYRPRVEPILIAEALGPNGFRGGRVIWVLNGRYIIAVGFNRTCERQIHMYNASNYEKVSTIGMDVSPSVLIPYYDEDSSVLFLTGRGDTTIFSYDVIDDTPYLRQLPSHRCSGVHRGFAFLMKNACDVRKVEFARALRLTETSIEPWAFTVPRVKDEYFQDDLFPQTKKLWCHTVIAVEWFLGTNRKPKRVCLQPPDMISLAALSHANSHAERQAGQSGASTAAENLVDNGVRVTGGLGIAGESNPNTNTVQLANAIKRMVDLNTDLNMQLEQDTMEGVDEEEWNEV